MPRYRRPPLTVDELVQPGPPVRLRDLIAITGLTSETVRADIAAGVLIAARRCQAPNAPYLVIRSDAVAWLRQIGIIRLSA